MGEGIFYYVDVLKGMLAITHPPLLIKPFIIFTLLKLLVY
jgi:hypothetical protein